jgi:hypothetical protein
MTYPTYDAGVEEAMRQQAAASLRQTYRWFRDAVPTAPALAGVTPALVAAVQLYEARQYPECLTQTSTTVETLRQARGAYPTLPPL